MKTTLRCAVALSAAVAIGSSVSQANSSETANMKTTNLKLTIGDQVLTASLDDNATSRDFVSLLPLTLFLKDYAATEKISDLPKRLSTVGASKGSVPRVGDIAYYAPWGNLAVFYKDFEYSTGLIRIAYIKGDVAALQAIDRANVRIELATQ